MIENSYTIDGIAASLEEFRSDPQREEAEDFLVAAYKKAIGRFICKQHQLSAGYQLRYITASGECKISTVACCAEFDAEINDLLRQSIAAGEADSDDNS